MNKLDSQKKKMKNIIEYFLPMMNQLRFAMKERNFDDVQDICSRYALKEGSKAFCQRD
jgi:hypothetical protein